MVGVDGKLRIAFVHPDLGIGGAERLVVDAAIGLQEQGHEVVIYTSHCDKSHCFEEIKNGLLRVEVFGDELPTNVVGRFFIMFANLRQLYLVMKLVLTRKIIKHDLYIVDQLSTCLPFLHAFSNAKLLFYCHFPDQLLSSRSSFIKRVYRIPFDIIEQFTMSSADGVVVNSKFTRSIYQSTFRYLKDKPDVIYPCVDLSFQNIDNKDKRLLGYILGPKAKFYLSINRYERKKNIKLALQAFAMSNEMNDSNSKLIICGGYDERVGENVEYLKELQKVTDDLGLSHTTVFSPALENLAELEKLNVASKKIIFLTSISSSLKELLLSKTELLLYTPSFEHFGIVPLEAMKYGKPVLAVNTGGPLETVESLIRNTNESCATGWLRNAEPKEWANAINEYRSLSDSKIVSFAQSGPIRVEKIFSREAMTQSFMQKIHRFINLDRKHFMWESLSIDFSNLLLLSITSRILSDNSWTYLVFALIATFVFKSYRSSFFWICIFLISLCF